MRRSIPLTVILIAGLAMIVQFFVPHPVSIEIYSVSTNWVRLIAAFSLVLGAGSLIIHHTTRLQRKTKNWPYSIVTLIGLAVTLVAGFGWGMRAEGPIDTIYRNIQVPLGAAMFSILAFYLTSASYRAFRARNREATILLVAAFLVMLGSVPVGTTLWSKIPIISEWILTVPNMAAKRAIGFGIALGGIATAFKIILGIERSWLGGER